MTSEKEKPPIEEEFSLEHIYGLFLFSSTGAKRQRNKIDSLDIRTIF